MRYSDLPPTAEIVVPTAESFTAMKLVAYEDRFAPHDLFDLGSLCEEPRQIRHQLDFSEFGQITEFTIPAGCSS
ncbi:MAG: hypothetical protein KJ698_07530 [Actinobacteria bacterium]|nr:hypothetical protein [Actinomycetota bacterium]MBU1494740.1 hypothetical protein [Actinomycetota bacterium]MBU1865475.1 hypothetical protein [Actinomycetota bacterium]